MNAAKYSEYITAFPHEDRWKTESSGSDGKKQWGYTIEYNM